MINRRNAVLGWAAWQVGKRILKQKAKAAAPGTVEGTRRPNATAILLAALAAGAVAWFWLRSGGDEASDADSPL